MKEFGYVLGRLGPGYTPGVKDIEPLVSMYVAAEDKGVRAKVRAAIQRMDPGHRPRLLRAVLATEGHDAIRLLASHAEDLGVQKAVLQLLVREDRRIQKAAARIAGVSGMREALPRLAELLQHATNEADRRVFVEAIGKIGGEGAERVLAPLSDRGQTLARARLMASRTGRERVRAPLNLARPVPLGTDVCLLCRVGLEACLLDEIREHKTLTAPRVWAPGIVRGTFSGILEKLYRLRVFEEALFPVARKEGPELDPLALADLLAKGAADTLLVALADGAVRFRMAFEDGAHKRAFIWEAADRLAALRPSWLNDPRESDWEFVIRSAPKSHEVWLRPKGDFDPRFRYRRHAAVGATTPHVAAALVRYSEPSPNDVVWDPFVGGGTELAERALAGPYKKLLGTDANAEALEFARENLATFAHVVLQARRAEEGPGERVNVIVTNPPMGRRLARTRTLRDELTRWISRAGGWLLPGGRMVFMSPFPKETAEAALSGGLRRVSECFVDAGGFSPALQVFRK